jgi:hypothetical protein
VSNLNNLRTGIRSKNNKMTNNFENYNK